MSAHGLTTPSHGRLQSAAAVGFVTGGKGGFEVHAGGTNNGCGHSLPEYSRVCVVARAADFKDTADLAHSDFRASLRLQVFDEFVAHLSSRAKNGRCQGSYRISDEALLVHIKAIHLAVKQEYGWPRMTAELRARGVRVGRDRLRRLMKRHGIKARGKKKYVVTTDSSHGLPIAPNLLQRDFQPVAPNRVWASDMTYIRTDEGWLFLVAVIDLFSRQVVGWSMRSDMQAIGTLDALRMAWFRRRPAAGLIFHSDRGSQLQQ